MLGSPVFQSVKVELEPSTHTKLAAWAGPVRGVVLAVEGIN